MATNRYKGLFTNEHRRVDPGGQGEGRQDPPPFSTDQQEEKSPNICKIVPSLRASDTQWQRLETSTDHFGFSQTSRRPHSTPIIIASRNLKSAEDGYMPTRLLRTYICPSGQPDTCSGQLYVLLDRHTLAEDGYMSFWTA